MKKIWPDIIINSPQGSGNNFARAALHNIDCPSIIKHEYQLLNSEKNNIFILRNPYDSILSTIELLFLNNKKLIQESGTHNKQIDQVIDSQIARYLNYLTNYSNENVYAVSFEFLTSNPKKFVENVTLKFNKKFDKNKFDLLSQESVMKTLIENSPERAPFRNDNPRKKLDIREETKIYLIKDTKIQNLYPTYLHHKDILQSTENMI
jgi:hypothetical protein